ncbi:transcriptional regulator, TetR family [Desulfuromusa kysingii]|uniref:Transcriptional regulator, TetR family n=1 Tax=Desulfuromusa kysingii TaxID=37625 RepID=A0A1H4AT84_9BACT|nr:TetR family transcriptional regulator [Desulfuromusa kysingii]SEA39110.1 transcriptional regulator, TetR family [Desulfuromusa kysingii]
MIKYQTSNKTQQALINAAGELAAEDGFNAITTRNIAERSGENIGSIHYHFGSKEKLFEATLLTACQGWIDNPLVEVLVDCNLQSKDGQAEAIRRAITRVTNLLFDKEVPSWYCRAVYQVMQTDNKLRDVFFDAVMEEELEQVGKLLNVIDPTLSEELRTQHFLLLFTPLFFHADYRGAILQRLGKEEYSEEYLDALLENCIHQALLRYRLPVA